MESLLSLFIFHDSYVVSFLVFGITIIVVMLLLFNQKSPDSVVKAELEGDENIEGALRRVLSEKQWVGAGGGSSSSDSDDRVNALEQEVLTKDRAIAELNKKLTQGGGGGAPVEADSDLLEKIAELEERLQEYEIIEDDIADLSLYRTENEKLKEELARLKALAGSDEGKVVEPEPEEPEEPAVAVPPKEDHKVQGADLVAEFEKVVNSQDQLVTETGGVSSDQVDEETNSGQVVVTGDQPKAAADVKVHEKLKDVSPDSKEEAEVFISELKSLKEGLKNE